jgi:hypothetical protein
MTCVCSAACIRIAKEGRVVDEHVIEQGTHFLDVPMQVGEVVGVGRLAGQLHAAREPAEDRTALVAGEVVTGRGPEHLEDGAESRFLRHGLACRRRRCLRNDQPAQQSGVARELRQTRCELADRKYDVGGARGNHGARHARVHGLARVLHEDDSACLPDSRRAPRAVAPAPGEDDREVVAERRRQRFEEQIDGRSPAARLRECRRADAPSETSRR